ncbi:MarR family winged helix-turn-helix transcriptional regulator [Leucobacter luti]|uniref:Uncharacterized protein n=1 Tax=Leucobacter luti TaxID=340320 RepID=A0A4Q7TIT0_9MICO|nr:MarR family winged helix-turn-helix transcriptional regulator [Leucobacter luti]RZT60531.1 hypothetical protein EV139_2976 [Leucobacter luti]
MSIWTDLNLTDNPYGSDALQASAEGASLLVGRDREVTALTLQLENTTLHPTVEGLNGVGKTSLVFVTCYFAMERFKARESDQLFLPMRKPLEIHGDFAALERSVYQEIAQSLLLHRDFLQQCGRYSPALDSLPSWLNTPILRSGGGGIGGLQLNVTNEANASAGFEESGFRLLVETALAELFPTSARGALVGIFDNMELLGKSSVAQAALERLRDGVLGLTGIRWVLCGSRGIVRASISSQRLTGKIASPIELGPIPDDKIDDLVNARLAHYSAGNPNGVPVQAAEFAHLYAVTNANLRDTLKYAQNFTVWLAMQGELDRPRQDFLPLLEAWLAEEAALINESIRLQPRQWKMFDDLSAAGGSCAPGDFADFGFNSLQAMRTCLVHIERAHLIDAEIDEDDRRRRTVSLSSKGWLVRYARSKFEDGAQLNTPTTTSNEK